MKTVLCFGDSNTYGLNPKDKGRFDYETRWTGILDQKLRKYGFCTAEEGLCGRTTMFPDALRCNRRGVDVLPFLLESHSPISYVVLMLGTNDCKTCFHATPESIGYGIQRLIGQIRAVEKAKILLVSPIHLAHGVGESGFDPAFDEASVQLSMQLLLRQSFIDNINRQI
ncbi:MAG: GDSL-type esterase/lipase family protein [Ruminococcus sp.]